MHVRWITSQPPGPLAVHEGVRPDRRSASTPGCGAVLWVLRELHWTGVLVLTAVIGLSTRRLARRGLGHVAMFAVGVVGYWDLTMITLSMMIVGGRDGDGDRHPARDLVRPLRRVRAACSAVLDTAQVMPAYVYLGVLVLAFGIRVPAGRGRNPGLRRGAGGAAHQPRPAQVPVVMTEVGLSFGSTGVAAPRQGADAARTPHGPAGPQPGDHDGVRHRRDRLAAGHRRCRRPGACEGCRRTMSARPPRPAWRSCSRRLRSTASRPASGVKATFLERVIPRRLTRSALLAGVVLVTTAITRIAGWSTPRLPVVRHRPGRRPHRRMAQRQLP